MALTKAQRLAVQLAAMGGAKSLALPEHLQPKKKRKPPTPLPDYCLLQPGPPGRWEVAIEGWNPTTINQLTKRGNHFTAAKAKRSDALILGQSLRAAGVSRAQGKRRVGLTIILGPRMRGSDPDAYHKSLLDGMQLAGALSGDDRKRVEILPVTYRKGKVKGSVVLVEDVVE
jgi:hypothetical protein